MTRRRPCLDRWALTAGGQTRRALLKAAAGLLSATAGCRNHASEAKALPIASSSIRWLAFYGVHADEFILATYDVVVLDPGFQGSIDRVAGANTQVCGYLSLGEIKTSDPSFALVDHAVLLAENPDWQGTRRVDVRHPSWRSFVLERQIPSIAAKGFTGLMIDTVDTAPYLELVDATRYHGMRAAAIELVDTIRARWPRLTLIMNRGYAVLPDVAESIDAVIAESLLTAPDQQTGGFAWVEPRQVELQVSLLQPAARRRPPLPILSLDYWHPDDVTTIAEIYHRERALGHHPYVATRLLDRIVAEPS
jgi:uncharacterized protein (TIGR01370 family)